MLKEKEKGLADMEVKPKGGDGEEGKVEKEKERKDDTTIGMYIVYLSLALECETDTRVSTF